MKTLLSFLDFQNEVKKYFEDLDETIDFKKKEKYSVNFLVSIIDSKIIMKFYDFSELEKYNDPLNILKCYRIKIKLTEHGISFDIYQTPCIYWSERDKKISYSFAKEYALLFGENDEGLKTLKQQNIYTPIYINDLEKIYWLLPIIKKKCLLLKDFLEECKQNSSFIDLSTLCPFYLDDFLKTNSKEEFFITKYKPFKNYIKNYKININKYSFFENYILFKISSFVTLKEHQKIRKLLVLYRTFSDEIKKEYLHENPLPSGKKFNFFASILSMLYYFFIYKNICSSTEKIEFLVLLQDGMRIQKELGHKIEILKHINLKGIRKYHDEQLLKLHKKRRIKKDKLNYSQETLNFIKKFPPKEFTPLLDESRVYIEGSIMKHCIHTYWKLIAKEKYLAFSYISKFSQERLTVGIVIKHSKKGKQYHLDQIMGKCNKLPECYEEEKKYLNQLINNHKKS